MPPFFNLDFVNETASDDPLCTPDAWSAYLLSRGLFPEQRAPMLAPELHAEAA
ncbi:MAG TPA: hypothetical protein VME66_09920 [Candidatus Acidoferrales bacterium]|nr:hypothetical protein [Candidatus Acidoferrales bacterium]